MSKTYRPPKNWQIKGADPGEARLFNAGFRLEITHLPTNYSVAFSAFIDQLSDSFTSNWASEQVYGRMDPIGVFSNTTRDISVVWNVPASSYRQAKNNLDKMNRLASFLYPIYGDLNGATSINTAPLWRVKFGNLICNSSNGGPLTGWVQGITIDPVLEEGIFMIDPAGAEMLSVAPPHLLDESLKLISADPAIPGIDGFKDLDSIAAGSGARVDMLEEDLASRTGPRFNVLPNTQGNEYSQDHDDYVNPNLAGVTYYPKNLRLNFEMKVLHEQPLGWEHADIDIADTQSQNDGQKKGTESFRFRGGNTSDVSDYGGAYPYASERANDDALDYVGKGIGTQQDARPMTNEDVDRFFDQPHFFDLGETDLAPDSPKANENKKTGAGILNSRKNYVV